MPRFLAFLAFILSFVLAEDAKCQSPVVGAHRIPGMVEGERLRTPGSFYSGGYSGSAQFTPFTVQLFEAHVGSEAEPRWIPWAIRVSGSDVASLPRQWADGRACPALYGVQHEFSNLAPPQFRSPRFHDLPTGSGGMAGPGTTIGAPPVAVWGYARQADGALMGLMFTGADGLLPRWVDYAERALASCWTTEAPVFEPAE